MKNEKYILFRLKRRILTKRIKNNVVKSNYQHYLIYNFLCKKYKKIIEESNYSVKNMKKNKTVWVCWLQGYEQAPELVKKCIDRIKEVFKGYKVVVITEENFKNYTDIPYYIIDKWKKGIITNTHFSDVLRVELLAKNGGVWIDSTVYATCDSVPKYLEENSLFVFKEINLNRSDITPIVASSWLIKSDSNNPIILLTRDLIRNYWKNTNLLIDYFLFHLFFSIATRKYKNIWDNIPIYNNINPHILQFEFKNKYNEERFAYYKKVSDFHKLTYKFDFSKFSKDSNYTYIMENKCTK